MLGLSGLICVEERLSRGVLDQMEEDRLLVRMAGQDFVLSRKGESGAVRREGGRASHQGGGRQG